MKPSNKTEVVKKEKTIVKYGPYKGKVNLITYEMGFSRERNMAGRIYNRGILFRNTKFPSGKKASSLLSDNITGYTKKEVITKAKQMIKNNKW